MQGPTTVVWYDLKLRRRAVCLGVTGERRGGKGFDLGGGRGHDTHDDSVGQRESNGELPWKRSLGWFYPWKHT